MVFVEPKPREGTGREVSPLFAKLFLGQEICFSVFNCFGNSLFLDLQGTAFQYDCKPVKSILKITRRAV